MAEAPERTHELEELHLSDLHALAAELGVPGYRLLRRDRLRAAIAERRGGEGEPGRPAVASERAAGAERGRARGGRGGRPRRERERPPRERERQAEPRARERQGEPGEREREPAGPEPTEEVTGILDITPQRYGFVRLRGLEDHADDVYISASQVRRCELRPGDEVTGPAREPRRGERHRALVHVDLVNGVELSGLERPAFAELTPVAPSRRVALDRDPADVLARAVDLLAPLALGQRVLVSAAPRSGRTTLLRAIARALAETREAELIVLLVDERPEETTAWRRALPEAQLAAAPADMAPREQARVATLALERARRLAEGGADAVLIADSLSRLAFAAGDVAEVKRLFGSGRDLSEPGSGSLTVVATVVAGADDGGDAARSVATTESSLITLDPELAAAGVHPALRPGECRVSNEEELRGAEELETVRRLRSLLADLPSVEAANLLRERIESTGSNADLLAAL